MMYNIILCNLQVISSVIIIFSPNSMPTFNYNCVVIITYNPDNISKKNSTYAEFLVWSPSVLFGSVRQTLPIKKSSIRIIKSI